MIEIVIRLFTYVKFRLCVQLTTRIFSYGVKVYSHVTSATQFFFDLYRPVLKNANVKYEEPILDG